MAIVYPVEIKEILKIQDGPLTGNLKAVLDGNNTPSALRLSTTQVEINGKVWPTAGQTTGKVLTIDNFGNMIWGTITPPNIDGFLPLTGGTMTGNIRAKTISERKVNLTGQGNIAIDLSAGSYFVMSITGSTTFSFTNVPVSGDACGFIVQITNGGTQNVFWPASVKWPKGVSPNLSANSTDLISFISGDGGNNWYGTFRPGA